MFGSNSPVALPLLPVPRELGSLKLFALAGDGISILFDDKVLVALLFPLSFKLPVFILIYY